MNSILVQMCSMALTFIKASHHLHFSVFFFGMTKHFPFGTFLSPSQHITLHACCSFTFSVYALLEKWCELLTSTMKSRLSLLSLLWKLLPNSPSYPDVRAFNFNSICARNKEWSSRTQNLSCYPVELLDLHAKYMLQWS